MNITKLALENSRITAAAIFIICLVGMTTYLSYPSAEDPSITIRTVKITANYPGMEPERVEELITKPIEAKMREIAEIDEINSTSKTGSTQVNVTIHDWVTDLPAVFQNIRNKAGDVAGELPDGTSTPQVFDEEGLTAIATIALWADGFSLAEMRDTARDIRDLLYSLDGVRKIEILGEQPERIYMETDPARMAQLGVSPAQVFGALRQQNVIESGGQIFSDGRTLVIEPSGNLQSVDEIGAVVFQIPETNRVLRLDEVVDVRRAYVDPPSYPSFFNDKPAIILSVSTVAGTSNVEFGKRLSAMLAEIQQTLPIGYQLDYATFQPELIAASVNNAVSNVYQTLGIVLAVVMLFLGVRTGLIVGFFVPLTMLLGILVMRFFDVELQRMSIAATIIALGMLVDNGIVVAEDIRVRLQRGIDRNVAAIQSGKILAIPLLTSSMTTIFAFLPMLLLEGESGEFVRSLAQVVAILLLGSWLLSLTVTPSMCAWFMKIDAADDEDSAQYDGPLYGVYRTALGLFLRFRFLTIAVLFGLLVLSTQLLTLVKTEFFPLGDRNQFLVYLDFEAGTDVRETQRQLRKLTRWLADEEINPEVTSQVAYVGYGGPRFFLALSPVDPDPHRGFVLVNTPTDDDVGPLMDRINAYMDKNLPAARADAKRMWFGATEPGLVQLRLIGPNGDTLADAAKVLEDGFYDIPGTVGIKQDWENKILKLKIEIDQVRARRAGVSSEEVASSLSTFFSGYSVSDYREGDKIIPIIFRGDDSIRYSLNGLQRVQVYSSSRDTFVGLEQVASPVGEWRFGRIKRKDQQRTLTVEARNPSMPAPDLYAAILPVIDGLDLPPGHYVELGGEIEEQAEANEKLFGMLPMALAGIVILLVGQFNSFRKGGIILATIPLILIGGTIGLFIMNAPYGFMVLLGFFSLAGILINNGIVLIDRIQIEEAAGRERLDAVVTACLARLRPILMTTLTTVLGLIPLILFGGALFYGMASVIAFGLIVATVLTLGFVPALYTMLFGISTKDAGDVTKAAPGRVSEMTP